MNTDQYGDDAARALRLFVILTRSCSSVAELARRDIARHGLSPSEFAVLELLYHKGPTPLGAVADRVLLTSGSITYVIDQLEQQGLVRRVACPTDRRSLFADLTENGRQRIAASFPSHAACIQQALSALSPEEQETVAALLKRLGKSVRAQLSAKAPLTQKYSCINRRPEDDRREMS
ncbi:MAG TPA: MarR family transcriptional regulator [Chthonomonadales bacterium]|nr:MarR family transcriptional regulator [Chthonomonadales bacterium]